MFRVAGEIDATATLVCLGGRVGSVIGVSVAPALGELHS